MERIRELRREQGLSQVKLAVKADMDPATLNRIEQGKGNPNLRTLERIADALGVEVVDLLGKASGRSSREPTLWNSVERHAVDVPALDEAVADDLRQQREFRLQELDIKLERAGDDQERREEAYRNLKNWWVWFTQHVMTLHEFIPEIPGPALLREGDITVERVREFARRTYTSEAQRDAELRRLEEAFRTEPQPTREET